MLPGKQFTSFFYVRSALGVVVPDALPTCVLIRNGIDTVLSVAVSTSSDGSYKAQSLIPSDWSEGDIVHLRINSVKNNLPATVTKKLGEISLPQLALAKEATLRQVKNIVSANL